MFLLLFSMPVFAERLLVHDDFNRPDHQNISYGYYGFEYYEEPKNYLDSNSVYNGEDEVFIKDDELYIEETEYCGLTTVVASFDHISNLSTYEDGRINFKWTNGATGISERWMTYVVFGQDLEETPSYTVNCKGEGEVGYWNLFTPLTKKFILFLGRNSYGVNNVGVVLSNGTIFPVEILNFANDQFHSFSLSFDVENNKTKLWIDEVFVGEFESNFNNISSINSIAFEAVTNEGFVTPHMRIDDLSIMTEKEEQIDPLLTKHAPVFFFHLEEAYVMKDINSMLSQADLKKGEEILVNSPISIQDIVDENSKNNYMDLQNLDVENLDSLPPNSDFEHYPTKVYADKIVDELGYVHLQYFMFYPFQDWFIMDHEGDWEMIQVTLDPNLQIDSIKYFFDMMTIVYYDFDDLQFFEETHPVVWTGLGSHNTYGTKGLVEFPEEFLFFEELLSILKEIETFGNHTLIVPEGSGVVSYPNVNYVLETTDPAWSGFKGLWGQESISNLRTGPRGPKYNQRFKDTWRNPEEFAYAPDIPFLSVFLYSPLDLKIDGKMPDEHEDIVLYNGPDSEPEFFMIQGTDYEVELEAESQGEYTLVLAYYDNSTDQGILLKYKGIICTENTRAKVNASKKSEFVLYIDDDGDGIYEGARVADEVIIYNGFSYSVQDLDGDLVPDETDNCPETINPGQEDFNADGFGDACDNPRYYLREALKIIGNDTTEDMPLIIAQEKIVSALEESNWIDDFTPDSKEVFLMSHTSSALIQESSAADMLISKAMSLIVEKKISLIQDQDTKMAVKGLKFYDEAEELKSLAKYEEAIQKYFLAWMMLEK